MAGPAFTIAKFHGGSTWVLPIHIEQDGVDLSISGATITAKLRKEVDDSAAVATWSCSITSASEGKFQCVLSAATTGALTYDDSEAGEWATTYFFTDILVSLSDGTVLAPIRFKILARKDVTR